MKSILRISVLGASACLLFASAASLPAAELVVDGMFATTPAALPSVGFSQDVGRSGSGAAYTFNGTTGSAGWQTTETDQRFEVWAPGAMGSPSGVGNTLELANNNQGQTIYQDVASSSGGGAQGTFSFGYASRDGTNLDKFTVTVTDLTQGSTLLTQSFNPSDPFSTNDLFSASLTLTPGDVYRVAFLDQNAYSTGTQSAHIDEVSFTQVPEPATWLGACLLLGGAGVVFSRRALQDTI